MELLFLALYQVFETSELITDIGKIEQEKALVCTSKTFFLPSPYFSFRVRIKVRIEEVRPMLF